jgi:hypothetical protein
MGKMIEERTIRVVGKGPKGNGKQGGSRGGK